MFRLPRKIIYMLNGIKRKYVYVLYIYALSKSEKFTRYRVSARKTQPRLSSVARYKQVVLILSDIFADTEVLNKEKYKKKRRRKKNKRAKKKHKKEQKTETKK